jgi:hypothetical protein
MDLLKLIRRTVRPPVDIPFTHGYPVPGDRVLVLNRHDSKVGRLGTVTHTRRRSGRVLGVRVHLATGGEIAVKKNCCVRLGGLPG